MPHSQRPPRHSSERSSTRFSSRVSKPRTWEELTTTIKYTCQHCSTEHSLTFPVSLPTKFKIQIQSILPCCRNWSTDGSAGLEILGKQSTPAVGQYGMALSVLLKHLLSKNSTYQLAFDAHKPLSKPHDGESQIINGLSLEVFTQSLISFLPALSLKNQQLFVETMHHCLNSHSLLLRRAEMLRSLEATLAQGSSESSKVSRKIGALTRKLRNGRKRSLKTRRMKR